MAECLPGSKKQILCLSAFMCVYMADRGPPQVSFHRSHPSYFLRQGL